MEAGIELCVFIDLESSLFVCRLVPLFESTLKKEVIFYVGPGPGSGCG
jgi:hypothetical protein